MVTKQTVKILTVSGQLEIGQAGNLVKHHAFRVLGPLSLTPIDECLSSKSVKRILWSPRQKTKDTSQDARRHHACLAFNIT